MGCTKGMVDKRNLVDMFLCGSLLFPVPPPPGINVFLAYILIHTHFCMQIIAISVDDPLAPLVNDISDVEE